MIWPDTIFVRHDLNALIQDEIGAAAERLALPNLAAFVASVGWAQTAVGGTVRNYLRDLVRQGWFEIRSPTSGRALRSGCSLVLTDKVVVFSFPDEPTLLLGVGDLGQGSPICAAVLADRGLLLGLAATDWGFSERHLPAVADVIRTTDWEPGPATGPLNLLLGDLNYAHHAWNQLSALEELIQGEMADSIRLVATQQPLGPVREIFPELAGWKLTFAHETELQALNARGALFAPAGGRIITKGLAERLLKFAETRISPLAQSIAAALAAVTGPILWMSVRTQNRTATNQHALLTALGRCFLKAAPDGAIVIDGLSLSADLASYPSYHQDHFRDVARRDLAAAEALRQALDGADRTPRVYVAVGLTITDSILLSRYATIYFCHYGTVQHKVGWFTPIPGVMHCNRAMLTDASANWVASQSEVALRPSYLPPAIVRDADIPPGANAEFNHLLRHENYTITDIPAAVAAFFRHARDANVAITITREEIMTLTEGASQHGGARHEASTDAAPASRETDQSVGLLPVSRPPNRHLLAATTELIPSGTDYLDFFRFIDSYLSPRAYFEIGTNHGSSLKAFRAGAVCVDPQFLLEVDVLAGRPETHFYQMTSDAFFAQHNLRSIFPAGPDVCFLDGLHRSEVLLRDFINTERQCHRRSIIFMHDCLPVNTRMALRTHELGDESEGHWQHAWTGDVWKIGPLLKTHRPDLKVFILDCAPTGLLAVTNLDPRSTVLADSYSGLVDELRDLDLETYSIRRLWTDLPVISSRSLIEHPEDLTLYLNIY